MYHIRFLERFFCHSLKEINWRKKSKTSKIYFHLGDNRISGVDRRRLFLQWVNRFSLDVKCSRIDRFGYCRRKSWLLQVGLYFHDRPAQRWLRGWLSLQDFRLARACRWLPYLSSRRCYTKFLYGPNTKSSTGWFLKKSKFWAKINVRKNCNYVTSKFWAKNLYVCQKLKYAKIIILPKNRNCGH